MSAEFWFFDTVILSIAALAVSNIIVIFLLCRRDKRKSQ